MTVTSRRTVLKAALAAPIILRTGDLSAQEVWPSRSVHVMVPFGAGGAVDTVCRVVFNKASEKIKQSIVIENRTGGNTLVASSAALQAKKDGYTFLVNAAQFITNGILLKDMPFDFKSSFVPVTRMAAFPQVLAVRQDFPAKTVAEYVAQAKANPKKVSYGTPPAAGMAHLAGAQLQNRLGIELNHAPYRLATEAVRDVSAGSLDSVILTTSTIQPALQGGKVRILAILTGKRIPSMPDVPTISETVLPGFDMDDWCGMFAPTGVPDPIIKQMQVAIADASADPAVLERLGPLGSILVTNTPAEFGKFLDDQRVVLAKTIKDANIKLE